MKINIPLLFQFTCRFTHIQTTVRTDKFTSFTLASLHPCCSLFPTFARKCSSSLILSVVMHDTRLDNVARVEPSILPWKDRPWVAKTAVKTLIFRMRFWPKTAPKTRQTSAHPTRLDLKFRICRLRDPHRMKSTVIFHICSCACKSPECSVWAQPTCSLSSVSCPDRLDTSFMVDSSFSCRFLISFCSPSASLLTSDMARIRGNQSKLCSWLNTNDQAVTSLLRVLAVQMTVEQIIHAALFFVLKVPYCAKFSLLTSL